MASNEQLRFPEIENRPEIKLWFFIQSLPEGQAPLLVRQQWLGIPLPLRYDRPFESPTPREAGGLLQPLPLSVIPDAVEVESYDCVKALRLFEREDAANWWVEYYENKGLPILDATLLFRRQEGQFVPPKLAHLLLPGLERFDYIFPREE